MGVLVGGLEVLVTSVVETETTVEEGELDVEEGESGVEMLEDEIGVELEMVENELMEEILVVDDVEAEVAVTAQLQALLTRLTMFPVHAATANEGMAFVAVTEAVVKVPQKACTST